VSTGLANPLFLPYTLILLVHRLAPEVTRSSDRVAARVRTEREAASVGATSAGVAVGGDWLHEIRCLWCKGNHDPDNIMLCDACNAGCHYKCGPAPFDSMPPETDHWLCAFCARRAAWNPAHGRPAPLPSPEVTADIGEMLIRGLAGTTVVDDPVIFADWIHWHVCTFGFDPLENVDFYNSDVCYRHRNSTVAGYLAQLPRSVTAKTKVPDKACHAMKRMFRVYGLKTECVFGSNSTATYVIAGLSKTRTVVRHTTKVGVTEGMIRSALRDAALLGVDSVTLEKRMMGLTGILLYRCGGRVSDFASFSTSKGTGFNRDTMEVVTEGAPNPHVLLVRMVQCEALTDNTGSVIGTRLTLAPESSKTTDHRSTKPSRRPKTSVFEDRGGVITDDEAGLAVFLARELPRWVRDAKLDDSDALMSFKHVSGVNDRSYHKHLTPSMVTADVQRLAGLEPGLLKTNFSSKSWKKSRVTHGVVLGEDSDSLRDRGNHATTSANTAYHSTVDFVGASSAPSFGLTLEHAAAEVRLSGRKAPLTSTPGRTRVDEESESVSVPSTESSCLVVPPTGAVVSGSATTGRRPRMPIRRQPPMSLRCRR